MLLETWSPRLPPCTTRPDWECIKTVECNESLWEQDAEGNIRT